MEQSSVDIIFDILPYAAVALVLACFLYVGYFALRGLAGVDENDEDVDWIESEISKSLLIGEITRGKGYFEKEYYVVKIPCGYGYDDYCFYHSKSLIELGEHCYITFHREMKIELILCEEKREEGKRYKRHKMDGQTLYDLIFSPYEDSCEAEKKKKEEQRKKETIGSFVCGIYNGNNYNIFDSKYNYQEDIKFWFRSESGRFSNSEFRKVQNVKVIFEIKNNVSKFEFFKYEKKINEYLRDYQWFCEEVKRIEERKKTFQTNEATEIFKNASDEYLIKCKEAQATLQLKIKESIK